ncbi:MarR family transcriptional regulator [Microvirga sp. 3-52]|jgi:DNA-binding MarR family transcriptional regulator|uniref:MarR family winged helix-turn-helix transcriptional regulator n=1 Tax=Microvirga sp. 3-52 TaxID=2792425 RepID=UPI001AC7294E|nr:MarR family transcriptional regulator [Microvirga sp. 3-52]MBO1904276.1 MarR family transcriptional regulator [Microvirga sp. 3-52]MBS7451551.1 MarR family transcriptional regulator [Microvirga sp. 3-52]
MSKLQLEQFLPYRLNRIAAAVSQDFRSVYGPHHDLTIPEWRVLATLGQFEAMSAKDIGRHSTMHKTKVSRAVRALEERRWLKRRESEEDRREEILTLTALGEKVYRDIVPKAVAFERRILDELGSEAMPLLGVLERLEHIFNVH